MATATATVDTDTVRILRYPTTAAGDIRGTATIEATDIATTAITGTVAITTTIAAIIGVECIFRSASSEKSLTGKNCGRRLMRYHQSAAIFCASSNSHSFDRSQLAMSFRLRTIFYLFALVAAALATFGAGGVFVSALMLTLWFLVFRSVDSHRPILLTLAAFVAIYLVAILLLPAVSSVRPAVNRLRCCNSLKQIAIALHNYHDMHGSLPSAHVVDTNGDPILSWRVAMLPFMEQQTLYAQLDTSKAWDSPRNGVAAKTSLPYLHCPAHYSQSATTDYYAVVDPRTAWPDSRGRPFSEITDGVANTIMLIEAHRPNVHWAEPRELTFDDAVTLLIQKPPHNDGHVVDNGFFFKQSRGRFIVLGDCATEFIARPLERELAEALLTVDGGEAIDRQALKRATAPELDYAKCLTFSAFVALSLLPAAWLGRRAAINVENTVATRSQAVLRQRHAAAERDA